MEHRQMLRSALVAAVVAGLLSVCPSAHAAASWSFLGSGLNTVNVDQSVSSRGITFAEQDGTTYAAWVELEQIPAGIGPYYWQVRVGRYGRPPFESGPWEQLTSRDNRINDLGMEASSERPGLTVIDGTPYVAWTQADGTNYELHVARYTGTWEQLGSGPSPLNVGQYDA